jgi:DNA replication protein DnaC
VPCEICDDTTWKTISVDGISRVTRCECWLGKVRERSLSSSGIPHKYRHCSLANFETHYDSFRAAHAKAQRFVDEFPAFPTSKRSLMIVGSFGVGKTHLAVAVLKAVIAKGARGYFCEVADLLKRVRDTFDSAATQELQVLEPVLHSDLLVVDDLGEEKTSEWVQEALAHVVNVRYSENRSTIFTTNLVDSADSTHPRSFVYKVGGRTRSRLIEMCDWLYMEGPDTREVGTDPSPDRIAAWQARSPLSPGNIERTKRNQLPPQTSGQLKAKAKPRFGDGKDPDLKWSGGKAGNR